MRDANWPGALLILAASVLAFSGLGILSASYLLVFKSGNPVNWAVVGLSSVVGGMMYPVSVLPRWLQFVARLIPVTYSLEGMRAAILGHATLARVMAVACGTAGLRGPSAARLLRCLFLGPAPDKNHRHAHAFLERSEFESRRIRQEIKAGLRISQTKK